MEDIRRRVRCADCTHYRFFSRGDIKTPIYDVYHGCKQKGDKGISPITGEETIAYRDIFLEELNKDGKCPHFIEDLSSIKRLLAWALIGAAFNKKL